MTRLPIARAAVQEAVRRRTLLIGLAVSLVFVAVFWVGYTAIGNEMRSGVAGRLDVAIGNTIMTVLGMYAVQFLAAFLSILLATGSVAGELDSGRALSVLARPLPRWSWLAQRVGTFAAMAVTYLLIMGGGILLLARAIGGYAPLNPAAGLGLLAMEVLLLMAVGSALSTRLSSVAAGSAVVALYGLAWIAGIMQFVGLAIDNDTVRRIGSVISVVFPSDALWRAASYHLQSPLFLFASEIGPGIPFASTTPPSGEMLAWSATYILVFATLAVWSLQRRDL